MREQAALSNAPEGYLDFHDEYAELIAELAALAAPDATGSSGIDDVT